MDFNDNNSRCYRFNRAGHEGHEYYYGNQQNYYHNNHHRNNNKYNYYSYNNNNNNNNGHHHQQQQRQQSISNHSYSNNRYNQYNMQQQQNRYNNSKYGSNNSYYQSNNNNKNNNKYSASSRQQKANKHQIISIKTETLISKKRDIKDPVFYDPECEIAKKCKAARLRLSNSMFEEEEKQRLIHINQCNLIQAHHEKLDENKGIDSDGFPVTPSGSEQDDDDDGDGEYDADKNKSIPWPSTKDTTMRSIMESTRDHTLLDENGRNLLNNDNNHRLEDYGIYDKAGIDKQVTMIPQHMAMDGGDLMDAARVITGGKTKKNGNGNGRRKGKRRRGGKGKKNRNRNKGNYDGMSKEERDCMDAQVVVDYIHRARQCVLAQNKSATDKQT